MQTNPAVEQNKKVAIWRLKINTVKLILSWMMNTVHRKVCRLSSFSLVRSFSDANSTQWHRYLGATGAIRCV